MTTADILANLCQYDPRNPDHTEDPQKWAQVSKGKECFCDNCHNQKTELAEELLKTREVLKQAVDSYEYERERSESSFSTSPDWYSEYLQKQEN